MAQLFQFVQLLLASLAQLFDVLLALVQQKPMLIANQLSEYHFVLEVGMELHQYGLHVRALRK